MIELSQVGPCFVALDTLRLAKAEQDNRSRKYGEKSNYNKDGAHEKNQEKKVVDTKENEREGTRVGSASREHNIG